MTDQSLGRLAPVGLRDIWSNEASDFTPWLARAENLNVLAEALGMELELEAQEKSVGTFRADILCKNLDNDSWVLVENQLGRTDHSHLGQLLTYAAGLDAVTIVWIAAPFTEEHRAALDWLNKITDEEFHFFGLEVELWRIGDSPAAPKFNVVAKPNDWSRSVVRAARGIDDKELSDVRILQQSYWVALNKALEAAGGPVSGKHRKAGPRSWMAYRIGRSGFQLSAVMLRRESQVRAELYIAGSEAKDFFGLLKQQQAAIETDLGHQLRWEDLPEKRDCRIAAYLDGADPENEADWPRQHKWLAEQLNAMHRVFAERVKSLNSDTEGTE